MHPRPWRWTLLEGLRKGTLQARHWRRSGMTRPPAELLPSAWSHAIRISQRRLVPAAPRARGCVTLPRSPRRCAPLWLIQARRSSKWTRRTFASRERRGSPGALRLIPSRLTQPHRAAAGVRRHLPRVGAYLRRQWDPGACAAAADCGRHAFHAFSTVLLTLITRARGLALPARRRDWYAIAPTALLGVVLANGLGPIRLGMVRAPLSGWLAGSGRDESHGRC